MHITNACLSPSLLFWYILLPICCQFYENNDGCLQWIRCFRVSHHFSMVTLCILLIALLKALRKSVFSFQCWNESLICTFAILFFIWTAAWKKNTRLTDISGLRPEGIQYNNLAEAKQGQCLQGKPPGRKVGYIFLRLEETGKMYHNVAPKVWLLKYHYYLILFQNYSCTGSKTTVDKVCVSPLPRAHNHGSVQRVK